MWSKESFQMWNASGRPTDIDRAREKYQSIMNKCTLKEHLCPDTKSDLNDVIESVKRKL
jgi:trimethylamine:corrinoid methyltransferase-like protein